MMLSLSRICNLEDFSDPELRELIRRIFEHELARFGDSFPDGHEYRKYWEVAMAVSAFEREGVLAPEAEVLGVGAGNEPTCFYLTRFVRRVFATDLYLAAGWEESANQSMILDPGKHWPFVWNPRRLVVQHMDARFLSYDDNSFDAVFSSSSIEHFGSDEDIADALDEVFRVLRPGGVAAISSEYKIAGEANGWPGIRLFNKQEIRSIIVGDRSWSLVDGFETAVSEETLATAQDFTTADADQKRQTDQLGGHFTHHIEYEKYPHIVLDHEGHRWTSFQVALRKNA